MVTGLPALTTVVPNRLTRFGGAGHQARSILLPNEADFSRYEAFAEQQAGGNGGAQSVLTELLNKHIRFGAPAAVAVMETLARLWADPVTRLQPSQVYDLANIAYEDPDTSRHWVESLERYLNGGDAVRGGLPLAEFIQRKRARTNHF